MFVFIAGDLLSQLVCFLSWRERKRKMENVHGQRFLFFLGTSHLISLPSVEGLTWTLDSFLLSPSLSNRPHLILLLSLSFSITLHPSVLSESASVCLFISASLSPLFSKTSVSESWAGVSLCSCFLVCVTCLLLNTDHKSLTSLQPLSKALWY